MKKIILILMLAVFGFSYSNDETYNITKNHSIENINSFSLISRNGKINVSKHIGNVKGITHY